MSIPGLGTTNLNIYGRTIPEVPGPADGRAWEAYQEAKILLKTLPGWVIDALMQGQLPQVIGGERNTLIKILQLQVEYKTLIGQNPTSRERALAFYGAFEGWNAEASYHNVKYWDARSESWKLRRLEGK